MSTFRKNSYWDAEPAPPREAASEELPAVPGPGQLPLPGIGPSSPRPGFDELRHIAGRLEELSEEAEGGGSFDPGELRELGERLDAAILEQLQSKP